MLCINTKMCSQTFNQAILNTAFTKTLKNFFICTKNYSPSRKWELHWYVVIQNCSYLLVSIYLSIQIRTFLGQNTYLKIHWFFVCTISLSSVQWWAVCVWLVDCPPVLWRIYWRFLLHRLSNCNAKIPR